MLFSRSLTRIIALTAILVFADSTAADLARRGWSRRLAPLLRLPRFLARPIAGHDIHLFTNDAALGQGIRGAVHPQVGRTFGERLSRAVDALAELGYERVVIVGRDCPDLSLADLLIASRALDVHRLVLGPDHNGGCYLIGLHLADRRTLDHIRWQQGTDFRTLTSAFGRERTHLLSVKRDLDSGADLKVLARIDARFAGRLRRILENRLFRPAGDGPLAPLPLDRHHLRWQLPPPVACGG